MMCIQHEEVALLLLNCAFALALACHEVESVGGGVL